MYTVEKYIFFMTPKGRQQFAIVIGLCLLFYTEGKSEEVILCEEEELKKYDFVLNSFLL